MEELADIAPGLEGFGGGGGCQLTEPRSRSRATLFNLAADGISVAGLSLKSEEVVGLDKSRNEQTRSQK